MMYKGFKIIELPAEHNYDNKIHHEIKGYSMHSGTFFQSVEGGRDPKMVIDKALDENNIELVATVFGVKAKDIHKRIVYFSHKQ